MAEHVVALTLTKNVRVGDRLLLRNPGREMEGRWPTVIGILPPERLTALDEVSLRFLLDDGTWIARSTSAWVDVIT